MKKRSSLREAVRASADKKAKLEVSQVETSTAQALKELQGVLVLLPVTRINIVLGPEHVESRAQASLSKMAAQ